MAAASPSAATAVSAGRWPPIALFHGTADQTVDWHHSVDFATSLRACGATDVVERYFEHKSHTDPILEDPLLSEADPLLDELLRLVLGSEHRQSSHAPLLSPAAAAHHAADAAAAPTSHRSVAAELRRRACAGLKCTAKWVNPF